jgi:soluble lytic murein transglycosylase-like protein
VNSAFAFTTSLLGRHRGLRLCATMSVAGLLLPSAAGAELVTLRGGRVLSVAAVRFDGEDAVLTLRTGGEMRAPRAFVLAVAPDEVPYPEPELELEPALIVAALEPTSVISTRDELEAMVDRLAAHHGVDAALAQAVVSVESNYQAQAVSPKGAMGLMQLMPATARHYALENPFDPEQNLDAGLRHLRGLLDRYGKGQESLALAAYNAGEGAVARHGGIPPFRETQNYVRRILTMTGR